MTVTIASRPDSTELIQQGVFGHSGVFLFHAISE
jgi:hypothetical protein